MTHARPRFRACSCRFPAVAVAILIPLLAGAGVFAAPPAAEEPAARRTAAAMAERLKAELRVRLPEDAAYCEQVAALVEDGRLPERLVTSTQAWAVAKGRKCPFPLFRKALETKATRLGLLP
ncbi:MAG: hypothetical protein ACK6CT_05605 [Planctomycetia bacterium]|jgi:hypothetical protein